MEGQFITYRLPSDVKVAEILIGGVLVVVDFENQTFNYESKANRIVVDGEVKVDNPPKTRAKRKAE